jgi:hypothetical protein
MISSKNQNKIGYKSLKSLIARQFKNAVSGSNYDLVAVKRMM